MRPESRRRPSFVIKRPCVPDRYYCVLECKFSMAVSTKTGPVPAIYAHNRLISDGAFLWLNGAGGTSGSLFRFIPADYQLCEWFRLRGHVTVESVDGDVLVKDFSCNFLGFGLLLF